MHLKTLLASLLLVTYATARPDLLRRDGAFAVRGRTDPIAATGGNYVTFHLSMAYLLSTQMINDI